MSAPGPPSTAPSPSPGPTRSRPSASSPPGPARRPRRAGSARRRADDGYELDFRVGGTETNRGGPPGGPVYTYEATYQDIVPDERIVYGYTMEADGTLISVSVTTVEFAAARVGHHPDVHRAGRLPRRRRHAGRPREGHRRAPRRPRGRAGVSRQVVQSRPACRWTASSPGPTTRWTGSSSTWHRRGRTCSPIAGPTRQPSTIWPPV